jgi:non-ribosomal peptide synthetase component F
MLTFITGETDIAIGTVFAGRGSPEAATAVGCFINRVVLRMQSDSDQSCRAVVHKAGRVIAGAALHQEIPYRYLLDVIAGSPALRETVVPRVWLVAGVRGDLNLRWHGIESEDLPHVPAASRTNLAIHIAMGPTNWRLSFAYDVGLFAHNRVEAMASLYARLLGNGLADPGQRVSHLRRQFAAACNDLLHQRDVDTGALEPRR